jgi:hypothetical protein
MYTRPTFSASIAVLALALLVGCSDERDRSDPPRSQQVVNLSPCEVLDASIKADLELEPLQPVVESYSRSCRYRSIRDAGDESAHVLGATVVIRHSTAANTIADARRLAEAYERSYQATTTEKDINGRKVYELTEAQSRSLILTEVTADCVLIYAIDATSSIQVTANMTGPDRGCGFHDLPAMLATRMPPTDERSVPPRTDRVTDVFTIDLCAVIDSDRRRALGLDDGSPSGSPPIGYRSDSCNFDRQAGQPGELTFLVATTIDSDAHGLTENHAPPPVAREVGSRRIFRTVTSTTDGHSCSDYYEVDNLTSFNVTAMVLGSDPAPACHILDELAPAIEPKLPLVVLEPGMLTGAPVTR